MLTTFYLLPTCLQPFSNVDDAHCIVGWRAQAAHQKVDQSGSGTLIGRVPVAKHVERLVGVE